MAGKTKAEIVAEQVAAAVGAGRKLQLESVDFNDPNRPKTCLEVDFPILPINQIAQIEGNAGKPIYQMSKWWARRRSSVFRSTLIAAVTKAPSDPAEASKTVWDAYYANHQDNPAFKKLKVADIFMGGGTTLVEGARLGMKMYGNDLNPVAWLVVKNEIADVDIKEVEKLFDHIEREVKPQIMPFYECEGPNGEKGVWTHIPSGQVMPEDFDPLALAPEIRKEYSYVGPEVIYTFWAKHGPCIAPGCGHRTPLMTNPVVAVKDLTVKAWLNWTCRSCQKEFDIERHEARMAPDASFVVALDEKPFSIMDKDGYYVCPHCHHRHHDPVAAIKDDSLQLPRKLKKNKKISLSLLVHPGWLKGAPGTDTQGRELGGTVTSELNSTKRWNEIRMSTLRLVEVRGVLPGEVTCPKTGVTFSTTEGTIPKKSTFTCQEDTCGRQQDVLDSIKASGQTGPMATYLLQCYSPSRDAEGVPYRGRFFRPLSENDVRRQNGALEEWELRKEGDLSGFWPKSELPYGFMTHHLQGGVPNHGFSHWYKMFNSRQLLVHALILKAIGDGYGFKQTTKEVVLGTFEQYLRNQNMFCFWNTKADKMEPMFSNNNYHPKSTVIENCVYPSLGRGNWSSCRDNTIKGLMWCKNPWETVSNELLVSCSSDFKKLVSGKSEKTFPNDPVLPLGHVECCSSTELKSHGSGSIDLVITDPPFGGLLHYSELADFFYVWLRLALSKDYPDYFSGEYVPKTLEAVSNRSRHPEDPDGFYKRILTACWCEAHRILKPGGILSFTFHHSEDEPWVDVLESLFDSGFYLEATYPIRSDETKGKGEFGSKTIEYDIIHVCRKRMEEPSKISWPRLRRQILADVRQLQNILEHHQNQGLPKADIQVIKRGKALEYFSRHYGQVYVEEGRDFTVQEALVGINQILEDQAENEAGGTPVICEPLTRQFLRIFDGATDVARDQIQKYLRGTGIGPSDFVSRGWCSEIKKSFHWASPLDFATERAEKVKSFHRDLDQAMLLIGACYQDSGISVDKQILTSQFKPHAALRELLTWLTSKGKDSEMRQAAMMASQLYNSWAAKHKAVVEQQLKLFDLEGEA